MNAGASTAGKLPGDTAVAPAAAAPPAAQLLSTPTKAAGKKSGGGSGGAGGPGGGSGSATTPGGTRLRGRRPVASLDVLVAAVKAKFDAALAAGKAAAIGSGGSVGANAAGPPSEPPADAVSPLPVGGSACLSASAFNREVKPGLLKLAYALARQGGGTMRREVLEAPLVPSAGVTEGEAVVGSGEAAGAAAGGSPPPPAPQVSLLEVVQALLPQGTDAWTMLVRWVNLIVPPHKCGYTLMYNLVRCCEWSTVSIPH